MFTKIGYPLFRFQYGLPHLAHRTGVSGFRGNHEWPHRSHVHEGSTICSPGFGF
jgi:hypothetical protein